MRHISLFVRNIVFLRQHSPTLLSRDNTALLRVHHCCFLQVTHSLNLLFCCQLLDDMSTIEWRLAAGCSDKIQLAALVGAFMVARESMTGE